MTSQEEELLHNLCQQCVDGVRVCYTCIPEDVRESLCLGRHPSTCVICGTENADCNSVWMGDVMNLFFSLRKAVEKQTRRHSEMCFSAGPHCVCGKAEVEKALHNTKREDK